MTTKNMNYIYWFLISFFLSANTVLANLRAPWAINRYPSYALSYTNTNLVVLNESLEFGCDQVYEGNGDYSKMIKKSCKVKAVYSIRSSSDVSHTLEFVLPSEKTVSIYVNDLSFEHVNPVSFKVEDVEKEGYRLSDLCRFCKSTINQLYAASFRPKFQTGVNTIRIEYEQPLAISEVSYGYFQSSKWMQGFAYELWPLREWKLDENFEMKIKFTTESGGFWSRLISRKLVTGCNGHDLRFTKSPEIPFKKQMGENGRANYYEYNQNLNPNYHFTELSKTYYENNKLIYELNLKENFPDRLICYFGHER